MRIPRALSVIIVYALVIALLVIPIGGLIPPLVDQSTRLANQLPNLLVDLNLPVELVDQVTNEVLTMLGQLPARIISLGVSIFSNLINVFAVLFIALYMLIGREKMDKYLESFLSKSQADRFEKIVEDLEFKLGGWARGQLILMLVVGIVTYIGLTILNVPFALPLAVLAGLLEFIPNLGPIVAAIPAVLVGASMAPITGVAVAALYLLVQQLEAYLIVPQVMNRSAGVSPIATLISLAIGFKLAGVVGALLAVPVYLTLTVIFSHYFLKRTD